MKLEVQLSREAARYFSRLDPAVRARMYARFDQIAADPLSADVSKSLTFPPGLRSARVGGYRILFSVDHDAGRVLVTRIAPRGQAYRGL